MNVISTLERFQLDDTLDALYEKKDQARLALVRKNVSNRRYVRSLEQGK